jgi:hypothetical protein
MLTPAKLHEEYLALRKRYPETFTTSEEQVFAWRKKQAKMAEATQQWFAAVWQLERLVALRPAESEFQARLEKARAKLGRKE